MRVHLPRRSSVAAGAAVAVLCALAGCGTSSAPTQTSPPAGGTAAPAPTAATTTACADVAELKSSLETLTKVEPAEDGVPALRTAIAEVRTDLTAAEASASEALKPPVEQVKVAFGNLQTAAGGLTAENRREKAPEISSAMQEVRTATSALTSTLSDSCPGR